MVNGKSSQFDFYANCGSHSPIQLLNFISSHLNEWRRILSRIVQCWSPLVIGSKMCIKLNPHIVWLWSRSVFGWRLLTPIASWWMTWSCALVCDQRVSRDSWSSTTDWLPFRSNNNARSSLSTIIIMNRAYYSLCQNRCSSSARFQVGRDFHLYTCFTSLLWSSAKQGSAF